MSHTIHALTHTEILTGITLEQIAQHLPSARFAKRDTQVEVPNALGPMLSTAVARCAFGIAHAPQLVGMRKRRGVLMAVYSR